MVDFDREDAPDWGEVGRRRFDPVYSERPWDAVAQPPKREPALDELLRASLERGRKGGAE